MSHCKSVNKAADSVQRQRNCHEEHWSGQGSVWISHEALPWIIVACVCYHLKQNEKGIALIQGAGVQKQARDAEQ